MASITLTIPDDQLERVVEALCEEHGWEDGPDAPPKEEFARIAVSSFLKRTVKRHEARLARLSASSSAEALTGIEFE